MKIFQYNLFFILKLLIRHDFCHFLQLIFHFTLKSLNFSLNFLTNHMFIYIYRVLIFVTKTIGDNYKIYSLIIIWNAWIVTSVRCGLFKISNVIHLTMLLPQNARYKIKVEWGIGGLKHKWIKLMKYFDSIKRKTYSNLFQATTIWTNFLRKHHLDFTYKIIGDQITNLANYGWDGDF
jgi:hypothetical protein